jgi:pimeloyl-ACP methyl ester carboxylesterase
MLWAAIVSVALLGAGYIYEQARELADRRRYPPPGKLVDVGDQRMHLLCEGDAAGPTVVIEQGIGSPSIVWRAVQTAIAQFARVCTYDRPGFLWSDPAATSRSLEDRVADLHALLKRADVPSPYILVGHSMGGLLVRQFARAHPDLVAGLVLVDSPDETTVFRHALQPVFAQGVRMQQILGVLCRFGVLRLVGRFVPMLMLPDDEVGYALCVRPRHAAAVADDMRAMMNASAAIRQPAAPGSMGDCPLIVLAHGVPFPPMAAAMEEGWSDGLRRVADLSTDSELVVAHKSGHLIYVDEPDLVVESVRRVYAAVREGKRLTAHARTANEFGQSRPASI